MPLAAQPVSMSCTVLRHIIGIAWLDVPELRRVLVKIKPGRVEEEERNTTNRLRVESIDWVAVVMAEETWQRPEDPEAHFLRPIVCVVLLRNTP
jgi:hypothetical protein